MLCFGCFCYKIYVFIMISILLLLVCEFFVCLGSVLWMFVISFVSRCKGILGFGFGRLLLWYGCIGLFGWLLKDKGKVRFVGYRLSK